MTGRGARPLPGFAIGRSTALACALALLAGCQPAATGDAVHNRVVAGSTTVVRDIQPVRGFLPNPALLTPGGENDPALLYRNPSVSMARYHALILEPVVVWVTAGSAFDKVPAADRQSFANAITSDLGQTLKAHCTVTTRAGPGVARLRPHPGQRALLADAGLVLPPHFQGLATGVLGQGCGY